MNHTRRARVSAPCTGSEAGLHPGLPVGMRGGYRAESMASWGLLSEALWKH